jgi:hypothetical protein
LKSPDTICTPLVIRAQAGPDTSADTPVCERAEPGQVAALKFRRGTEQRGPRARYAASARGTAIELSVVAGAGAGAGTLVTWKVMDPISRVAGVYLSPGEKLVAVEFQTRFAGRLRTDVVAFALPAARRPGTAPASEAAQEDAPGRAGDTMTGTAAPELSPAAGKALVKARGLARRGRHKAAEAAYRKVLEADPEHAEARYGLARSRAGQRDPQGAVAALQALAGSGRDDAIIWLVEARFDKVFARLRGNPGFRRATGLDRQAGQAGAAGQAGKERRLYERLLGFSSTWEQPETKCESAQINLDLDRSARTFALRITSRCGGYTDQTRLRGSFALEDPERVILTMPNKKGPDDPIECAMQVCAGEDCLHCRVDQDLDFVLRPVRR